MAATALKRLSILSIRRCSRTTEQSTGASQHTSDRIPDSDPEVDQHEDEDQQVKERIMGAALTFVPQHGWTRAAISAGAEAEGMPHIVHGMFPRAGAELVSFFYTDCNRRLAESMAKEVDEIHTQGLDKPKVRPFIAKAVETRLSMIIPYIEQWPQAMAIQTLPQNAMESWTNLSKLTDDIWYYAGDRSTNFNWYTKRASLAALYKGTEIYMLQDRSDSFTDTWAFLDRRLHHLDILGKNIKSAQQWNSVFGEAFLGMCIVGRNLMGMNARHR